MSEFFNGFISYGRADSKAFAIALHEKLTRQGLKIWLDQNDIPLAVDFQEQINDGIEKAHNFIFIISPHSVNSPYCLKEIELAVKYHKRIIPLLHVEEITQQTWLQRNPNGTDEQWQAYQAKGLHSSMINMHPIISKLNWVYFREEIDEFETNLEKLINLFQQEQDYIEKHTHLLLRALKWENHQKQPQYLLVGQERIEAEIWLKTEFINQQPPCQPTDIHCEFICESVKNSKNLMSEVFICYADLDKSMMIKIRQTLMRHSITVWTNQTDIESGTQFEQEIKQGIEQSDNIIYLISSNALSSEYCQMEFNHALAQNKRIIPLLIESILDKITPQLLALQFIDLTESYNEDKYNQSLNKLLKALKQEAQYYEEHKLILTKAIKWKRQNQNPSLLLRGYNLSHAEAWLKVGKTKSQHQPTALQEKFIQASLQQTVIESLDVFISYSRVDSDFARKLNDALQEIGKTTWFDQESIASGVDFKEEIYRGIESSDNFVFIISPQSVNSPYCADEVEYAQKLNKRVITILYQEVSSNRLHPVLAQVQWINFHQYGVNFAASFNELVRTLDSDRDHVRNHTKWSQRAKEWQTHQESQDLLLRGSEFILAKNWLQQAEEKQKQPLPTQLQKEFIGRSKVVIEAKSKRAKRREMRLRIMLGLMTMAFISAVGLGWFAFSQRNLSIKVLRNVSQAQRFANKEFDGLLLAIQAGKILQQFPVTNNNDAVIALQGAINDVRERNRLSGGHGPVYSLSFNAKYIATAHNDGTVILWNWNGSQYKQFEAHDGLIWGISFSPDGRYFATVSGDKTAKLWSQEGQLIKILQTGKEYFGEVTDVSFSPDGQIIAVGNGNGTVNLYRLDGELFKTLEGHQDLVWTVKFSPDNKIIASGSADGTIKLWDKEGKLLQTLEGHQDWVWSVSFSPDGQSLVSGGKDGTIKLWDLKNNKLVTSWKGDTDSVLSVNFSPDGQTIISSGLDKIIKIWNLKGQQLDSFEGHENWVWDTEVISKGQTQTIASASKDGTVRLWEWKQNAQNLKQLLHPVKVTDIAFSPNGQMMATANTDKTLQLWNLKGEKLKTFQGHLDEVWGVSFSPDGQTVASVSEDKLIKLWDLNSNQSRTFVGHKDKVWSVKFSPDGKIIASASSDGTVKLWSFEGQLLKTIVGNISEIHTVSFSPDGKLIALGGFHGKVALFSSQGQLIRKFNAHPDSIFEVTFSPDGKMLATASADKTVKLWNLQGEELETFIGHRSSVYRVRFSPDGKFIATASADNTAKIWSLKGLVLQTFTGHTAAVNGIDISPDGKTLATVSSDKSAILYSLNLEKLNITASLSLDALMKSACNWAGDYLKYNPEVLESDRNLCP